MSNLVKVICFLLVAAATSVSAQSPLLMLDDETQESLNEAVSSITRHLEAEYDRQVRQLQEFISRDSTMIHTLKRHRKTKLEKDTFSCYEKHKKMCVKKCKEMDKAKKEGLQDLEKHKKEGEKCLPSSTSRRFDAGCIKLVQAHSLATLDKTVSSFEESVEEMRKEIIKCDDLFQLTSGLDLKTLPSQQEE